MFCTKWRPLSASSRMCACINKHILYLWKLYRDLCGLSVPDVRTVAIHTWGQPSKSLRRACSHSRRLQAHCRRDRATSHALSFRLALCVLASPERKKERKRLDKRPQSHVKASPGQERTQLFQVIRTSLLLHVELFLISGGSDLFLYFCFSLNSPSLCVCWDALCVLTFWLKWRTMVEATLGLTSDDAYATSLMPLILPCQHLP